MATLTRIRVSLKGEFVLVCLNGNEVRFSFLFQREREIEGTEKGKKG